MSMVTIQGKGVFGGVAIGRISFYSREKLVVKRRHIEDPQAELERLEQAKTITLQELQSLYEKARKEVGEASAAVFEIHQMMVEDEDYNESIANIINSQKLNAEYAVATTADHFAQMFSSMDDDYMRGRAADVHDVSDRLLKNLMNKSGGITSGNEKVILCADDLAPSETVQLDKDSVMAFATCYGSTNSHTAILARTMNIPAIIGLGESLTAEYDGKMGIVDGFTGTLYIEPDDVTLAKMQKKQAEDLRKKKLLQELKGKDNISKDGQHVNVFANIGSPQDMGAVLMNDAGGVGLFRSEFLYLESEDYPTEEAQFAAYRTVLESMGGKKVVIRTLDIGADKQIDYFKLDKEENPALGYRAIRICLTRPEIFKTQLRALMRASVYGNLSIMFPMIISAGEVRQIKKMLDTVKAELNAEGIPYKDDVEIGIMIETPASVIISDELAKEVDFFSVGTNDLTQYTLACDRQNPKLEPFCDTHHPAILRMIKMAADNAHKNGCWIGICGELGADTSLTEVFLAMGIDELSVSPGMVLPVRDQIINSSVKDREEEVLKAAGVL